MVDIAPDNYWSWLLSFSDTFVGSLLMKKTDLAYAAGIVDGEGSISLHHNRNNNAMALRVRITSTDEWLCLWFKLYFGGSISVETTSRNKPCFKWIIGCKKAGEFLSLMLPYLHIKKPQAELALQFQGKKRRRGAVKMPKELRVLEEAQFILMQKLKDTKRGIF